MKILSFDIEEWYVEKAYRGGRKEMYRIYDEMLDLILQKLDESSIRATFFCLGKIATDFPHVIKKIVQQGHDIGCHSNEHIWLNKLSPKALYNDTANAMYALEDLIGRKVVEYRAPAFSIGDNNKWVLEILCEFGIERDASIFPTVRDFGGFASFTKDTPCIIEYNGCIIKEFPIIVTKFLGQKVAYSGGGYFRFFPYKFVFNRLQQRDYGMCYFHIADLIYQPFKLMSKEDFETYFREDGSLINRIKRGIKSSIGTKSTLPRMLKLISSIDFIALDKASQLYKWDESPKIKLI